MYSYAERLRAVKLYIKHNLCVETTIRELGYPAKKTLYQWYREYMKNGRLHKQYSKKLKYSPEQRRAAVDYYMDHGHNISQTIRVLGYPCRVTMREWLCELRPNSRKVYSKHSTMVEYSTKQKEEVVIEICTGCSSVTAVSNALGISKNSLYKWKKQLLGEGCMEMMKNGSPLPEGTLFWRRLNHLKIRYTI